MKWPRHEPVVVDTNVIISGLQGAKTSYPSIILAAWGAGTIHAAISPQLLQEVLRVLQKPRFSGLLKEHIFTSADGLLYQMLKNSVLFYPRIIKQQIFSDRTDHFLLELAVAARASTITTGDKGLLRYKRVLGVELKNPKEFCQQHNLRRK